MLFTGCAKGDRDIANEVANIDPYFIGYELELSDYIITKRQTNDDDKTDFVWISLSGENEDFLYTASYEVTYIKYNDGWHLEAYNMLNSNYKAKGRPSSDEVCSSLSERYSNIEYVNSEPFITSNNVSYCLTGEVVDGYITKSFDIIISYEFSPERGWVEVSESKNLSSSQYNIIGEWQYEDAEHLYYLHIAEVDGNSVTMKYTFWNKDISPDDDYWQLRQSEYTTYNLNSLHDAIELECTGYSVDELRDYFQNTLNLPIYEDSTSGFIVVIPNTDLRLRIWIDIFSAKVDIYLNR